MQISGIVLLLASVAVRCEGFIPATLSSAAVHPSTSRFFWSGSRQVDTTGPSRRGTQTGLKLAGVQEAWSAYNEALQANPLLVKSVTAGVILGAGDLAGQALEASQKEGNSQVDLARTARFAFFGLVLQAPWNHYYYLLLDGAIPPTEDPFTATTGIKVVIDQFVQAPIFTVLIFAFLGFLEGKSTSDIKQKLDEDYVNTMFANCELPCY